MRVFSFHVLALFATVFCHNLQAQNQQVFENQKLAADSAFEVSDYPLALERYGELIESYSKAGLPKNEFYYLSLFRNLDCLIITKKFDEAEVMQNEISTEVFDGDGKAYLANYHFLKAKLLFRAKRAYQESYNEYQLAYKIKVEEPAPSELRAETAHELAVTLTRYLGKHDSAIYYYNRAISDYTVLQGSVSDVVANELGFMSATFYNLQALDKNMHYLKKSALTYAQVIDTEVLSRMATTNSYDSVNVFLRELIRELDTDKFINNLPKSSVAVFANIGNGLVNLNGSLALAEDYFNMAMALNMRFENVTGMAGISQGLASIYYRRNQFQFALDYYDIAAENYLKTDIQNPVFKNELAWIYLNKGFLFNTLGSLDSAQLYHKKAIEMLKEINNEPHWTLSYSYLGLGATARDSENYEEAIEYFDKAEYNQIPNISQLYFAKAEAYRKMNDEPSALTYFRKAIALVDKANINYHLYLNALADYWKELDRLDSAIYYLDQSILGNQKSSEQQSIKSLEQVDYEQSPHPILLLQSLGLRAETFQLRYEKHENIDDLSIALEHYDLSREIIAFIRTSLVQEIDNIQFNEIVRKTIEGSLYNAIMLADLKDDNSYLEKAFQMVDMGKSHIVMDAMKTRQIRESSVNEALTLISEMKRDIGVQKSFLQELILNNESEDQIQTVKSTLLLLQNQLLEKLSELKESQPNIYRYLSEEGSSFSQDELRDYLTVNNSTLIEFFWGNEALYGIMLNDQGISLVTLSQELEKLSTQLDRFKGFLKNPSNAELDSFKQFLEDGPLIYQTILGQIPGIDSLTNLIVVPDGPLSNLPFDALLTKSVSRETLDYKGLPYLLNSKKVDYISSAAILIENLKKGNKRNLEDFAAWAPFSEPEKLTVISENTLRDEGLESLPGSGKELETLASVFDGINFTGSEATEESFKANVNSARVIHIATHGIINDKQTVLSNLLFNDDKETSEDNRLYMFEIYGMSLNTELAVLTACNTGAGKQEQGEGMISLARAFKYAGAKSVLMSLWLANDQSTSDIVGDFYRNLADNQSKGEALRNAKLKYLNQADNLASHPFYWSHLVLSGDNSPLPSSGFPTLWLLIGFGLLVVAFLGFRKNQRAVN